ncbi:MarR family winged helix-turn-helix transcriptional regulator [Paenibacillus gansuensis]|uniref:MarR family winged helix-turn-helix transcriptional regulator n=1 Tax=Paenibacillus gansuensis TaxID=306542 RepID=A0ABW5PA84_9BACL
MSDQGKSAEEELSIADRFQRAMFTTARRLGPDLVQQSKLGITANQFFILKYISRTGSCRLAQLAELMEVKPSAITVIIDRLESNKLVVRQPDSTDRRAILVHLTDYGRKALKLVDEIRKEQINKYLSKIEEKELLMFLDTFEKLAKDASGGTDKGSCSAP